MVHRRKTLKRQTFISLVLVFVVLSFLHLVRDATEEASFAGHNFPVEVGYVDVPSIRLAPNMEQIELFEQHCENMINIPYISNTDTFKLDDLEGLSVHDALPGIKTSHLAYNIPIPSDN
jgi:hypothetical protein